MSKQFKILQDLVYYDQLQLFVAVDQVNTKYMCMLIDENRSDYNYVATQVSPLRLANFKRGVLDLREVFERPEIREFYGLTMESSELRSVPLILTELPEAFLPDSGFYLFDNESSDHTTEDDAIVEAIDTNNVAIRLSLIDNDGKHSPIPMYGFIVSAEPSTCAA